MGGDGSVFPAAVVDRSGAWSTSMYWADSLLFKEKILLFIHKPESGLFESLVVYRITFAYTENHVPVFLVRKHNFLSENEYF